MRQKRKAVGNFFRNKQLNSILPQSSFKINKRLRCWIWFFQCWCRSNKLISSRATCVCAPHGPTDSWAFHVPTHARTHECFSRCSEFFCHRSAVPRCCATTATTPATLKQSERTPDVKDSLLSSEGLWHRLGPLSLVFEARASNASNAMLLTSFTPIFW